MTNRYTLAQQFALQAFADAVFRANTQRRLEEVEKQIAAIKDKPDGK